MANILIVDDDSQVIQQLTILTESFNHTPSSTLYPTVLFKYLESEPIDLLLLDINMPEINGITLLKQLKAHPIFHTIPVIMLTGSTDKELLKECFEAGAADYINKPFDEVVLQARIQSALTTQDYIKKIQIALKEKEILLKEIHHRVKNNLAIVSSFLGLQADSIKEENILYLFRQAQDRVYAMSLIHEKLYQSDNLTNLNAKEFIQMLSEHLLSSYSIGRQDIELQVDVEEVWLGIDDAIPCGLIINELFTNALKYAFPTEKMGKIQISLENVEGKCKLTVYDNGKGIPEEIDFETADSLGLRLIKGLSMQLDGIVELDRSNGTTFRITFPLSQQEQ